MGREINSSFLSAEENNLEETSVASSNIQKAMDQVPGSVLVFTTDKTGGVIGNSLMEMSLVSPDTAKEQKVIIPFALTGKAVRDINKSTSTLSFSYSTEDGSLVESVAELSSDNSTLIGHTKAFVSNGKNRSIKTEYNWTAYRYKGKTKP